jgi:hypothetical protein
MNAEQTMFKLFVVNICLICIHSTISKGHYASVQCVSYVTIFINIELLFKNDKHCHIWNRKDWNLICSFIRTGWFDIFRVFSVKLIILLIFCLKCKLGLFYKDIKIQFEINVREYRRDNHKWTFQRNWQHRVHKTKTNKIPSRASEFTPVF